MDTTKQRLAGLLPVQSLSIYGTDGDFHPQGLYSNQIFGEIGKKERNTRHGKIVLNVEILHPKIFEELISLNRLYKGILMGKDYARWDKETRQLVKADILDGETGYAFFMTHFKNIDFKVTKSQRRGLKIDLINRYRDTATLKYLIVLPAGLRDITKDTTGRDIEDEINKLYRRVLMTSTTIGESLAYKNDPVLDRNRWMLQSAVQDIYKTLITVLEGKRGFLQSKWGSRKVAHGTRNVISAMDPSGDSIDSPRAFDSSTTHIGLYQTLRGVEPLVVDWAMVQGIAKEMIENIDSEVALVDMKTRKMVTATLSEKVRVQWATEAGRGKLLTQLSEQANRNKPIILDDYYFKLVYHKADEIRILNSIDELPEDRDPADVHPMTWTEYFYLTLAPEMARVRAFVTRYPVTSQDSIYPTVPYLKTTVHSNIVNQLDSEWHTTDVVYPEFPELAEDAAFFDSVSVSISQLGPLEADFDGDDMLVNV